MFHVMLKQIQMCTTNWKAADNKALGTNSTSSLWPVNVLIGVYIIHNPQHLWDGPFISSHFRYLVPTEDRIDALPVK